MDDVGVFDKYGDTKYPTKESIFFCEGKWLGFKGSDPMMGETLWWEWSYKGVTL